jgi:aspartyl protease family protein
MLRLAFSMLLATIVVAFFAGAVINGKLRIPLPLPHPAAPVAAQEPAAAIAPTPVSPVPPTPVQANSSAQDQSDDAIEIEPDGRGQFETDIYIRGRMVHVLIDTGAVSLALTYQDAMAIGLYLSASDFSYTTSTANGRGKAAKVRIEEVRIGDFSLYNVDALVMQPSAMQTSLLGMNVLSRLGSVHIADGRLVLQR